MESFCRDSHICSLCTFNPEATVIHHKAVYCPYRLNQTRIRPPTMAIAAALIKEYQLQPIKGYETGWNKYLAFCDQCKQQVPLKTH